SRCTPFCRKRLGGTHTAEALFLRYPAHIPAHACKLRPAKYDFILSGTVSGTFRKPQVIVNKLFEAFIFLLCPQFVRIFNKIDLMDISGNERREQ
ncbi:hypothetical protein, partial [uncultured Rikenella sp.]|uniref:hypothetical protein n=1 Tax=uncultured Rikenella sp. TaxID=368003 RepID=UPI002606ACFC